MPAAVELYIATAVPFYDPDQPRDPHGRWGEGGGGGDTAVARQPGGVKDHPDAYAQGRGNVLAGAAREVDKAIASMPKVQIADRNWAVRAAAALGGKIPQRVRTLAENASEGLKHASTVVAHLGAPALAAFQVAVHSATGHAMTVGDGHHEKLSREYGPITANLIVAGGNLLSTAAGIGLGALAMHHLGGMQGNAAAVGRGILTASVVGTAGLTVARSLFRYPAALLATGAFKTLGVKRTSDVVRAAQANDALKRQAESLAKGGASSQAPRMFASEADFARAMGWELVAEFSPDEVKDKVTLSPENIQKLGALVHKDVTVQFYDALFSHKDLWGKLKGGGKPKAGMSYYLDGRAVTEDEAVAALVMAGIPGDEALFAVADLEAVLT
jgi:hypothetical protein